MSDDFTFLDSTGGISNGSTHQVIRVLGIGGCGNKAVNYMIEKGLKGLDYLALNADPQDLDICLANKKILIGEKATKKGGCGGKPELGREACLESIDQIKDALKDSDMVFLTAGLGGGTGSGGAPVIAEFLGQLERPPLIVGVVTTPFAWEMKRLKISEEVVALLTRHCNSVITVSNAKLQASAPRGTTVVQAMSMANDILYKAVAGIIEILVKPGLFGNLDFNDIKSVMEVKGPGLIGLGEASGEDRAKKALMSAITSPLMGNSSIKGAKKILVNITGDESMLLEEFTEVSALATKDASPGVEVFAGSVMDNTLSESGVLRVTVIATGIGDEQEQWDAPPQTTIDRVSDAIVTLEDPAEDLDIQVRPEAEAVVRAQAPRQVAARPAMAVGEAPRPTQFHPRPYAAQPQPALPKRPSKYETHLYVDPRPQGPKLYPQDASQGVEPVNSNPKKYAEPTFMRKSQS